MPSFVFFFASFSSTIMKEVILMKSTMDTAIRIVCGKTQQDLADEACLGVNTIWRYENGDSVRESTYNKVQAALYRLTRDYMGQNCIGPGEFFSRVNLVLLEINECNCWIRPKNY